MHKEERQTTIRNIISARPITRQDELVRLLRRNGHNVTQASISRDLDVLGITKVNGAYALPAVPPGKSIFGPVTFTQAGTNLIVIKCSPGYASAAASKIDNTSIDGIEGTIAGDDTIFVAIRDETYQKSVFKRLVGLFND